MTERQLIAILTAILRAHDPSLDGDKAVLCALEIVRDVDFVMAFRGAFKDAI